MNIYFLESLMMCGVFNPHTSVLLRCGAPNMGFYPNINFHEEGKVLLCHDKDYEEKSYYAYCNERITINMDSYGADFVSLQSTTGIINANPRHECNGRHRQRHISKG